MSDGLIPSSENSVSIDWETLESTGAGLRVLRAKVWGGWLVAVIRSAGNASQQDTLFIADPFHQWKKGWEETVKQYQPGARQQ